MMIPALWQEADFTAQMLHLEHGADHLAVIPLEGRVEMHHFRQLVTSPPTQAHPQGLYWQSCSTHTRHFARIHTPDRYSNKRAREAVRICSLRATTRWKDRYSNKWAQGAVRIASSSLTHWVEGWLKEWVGGWFCKKLITVLGRFLSVQGGSKGFVGSKTLQSQRLYARVGERENKEGV